MQAETYVEFFFRGFVLDGTATRKVASRDIENLQVPDGAYGFRFYDLISTTSDGEELISKKINKSAMYYFGGRVMTVKEVLAEMPEEKTLISNMRINGYDKVIICSHGGMKPFMAGDILIQPPTE